MEKAENRPGQGNRSKRRNEEDGEAKRAQSALALLLENTGVKVLPQPAVPRLKKLGGV